MEATARRRAPPPLAGASPDRLDPTPPRAGRALRDLQAGVADLETSPMKRALMSPEGVERANGLAAALDRLEQRSTEHPPFDLHAHRAALDTMKVAVEAGYPCFENGILMPDEPPANWTAHFKPQERAVVETFIGRAASPQRVAEHHGYVCERGEANQFGIRALIQEHHKQGGNGPVIVASADAHAGVHIASEKYGVPLETIRTARDGSGGLDLEHLAEVAGRLAKADRPVVMVLTLGTDAGGFDDLAGARRVLDQTGVRALLHVDAARSFDFLPTDASGQIEAFSLRPDATDRVVVHSVVGGGLSTQDPAQVATMKPKRIGDLGREVSYVRGLDATISGSRPAIDGLTLFLNEARFGADGKRAIAAHCDAWRGELVRVSKALGLEASAPKGTLDLRIWGPGIERVRPETLEKWGLARVPLQRGPGASAKDFALALTVEPSAAPSDAEGLARDLCRDVRPERRFAGELVPRGLEPIDLETFSVRPETRDQLAKTITEFVVRSRDSAGYPGNQATLQAMSRMLAPFVHLGVPRAEVTRMAKEVLDARFERLGVGPELRAFYDAAITTGSTMGNQIGLINALRHFPERQPILYMSDQTHYSGEKIARDNAQLRERLRMLPSDHLGAIDVEAFAAQLQADAEAFPDAPRILLANRETTFAGGSDDLAALTTRAEALGAPLDYVHLDGALGLGAGFADVRLARPGERPGVDADGTARVQGLTVSNHKFPGLKVSGVVIGQLASEHTRLPASNPAPDPMAVLQLWAFDRAISPKMAQAMRTECAENSRYLRAQLRGARLTAYGGEGSLITVIDHPPIWLLNRYQLAPEGQHAHVITMPHVARDRVNALIRDLKEAPGHIRGAEVRATRSLRELHPSLSAELVTRRPVPAELLDSLDGLMAEVPGDPFEPAARRSYLERTLNTGDGILALVRGEQGRLLGAVIVSQEPRGLEKVVGAFRLGTLPLPAGQISQAEQCAEDLLKIAVVEAVTPPPTSGRKAGGRGSDASQGQAADNRGRP